MGTRDVHREDKDMVGKSMKPLDHALGLHFEPLGKREWRLRRSHRLSVLPTMVLISTCSVENIRARGTSIDSLPSHIAISVSTSFGAHNSKTGKYRNDLQKLVCAWHMLKVRVALHLGRQCSLLVPRVL